MSEWGSWVSLLYLIPHLTASRRKEVGERTAHFDYYSEVPSESFVIQSTLEQTYSPVIVFIFDRV